MSKKSDSFEEILAQLKAPAWTLGIFFHGKGLSLKYFDNGKLLPMSGEVSSYDLSMMCTFAASLHANAASAYSIEVFADKPNGPIRLTDDERDKEEMCRYHIAQSRLWTRAAVSASMRRFRR